MGEEAIDMQEASALSLVNVCLSVCLVVCLSVCLFVCLCVYLFMCVQNKNEISLGGDADRQKRGLHRLSWEKVARQKKLKVVKQTILILIIILNKKSHFTNGFHDICIFVRNLPAIFNIKIQQEDHYEYLCQFKA